MIVIVAPLHGLWYWFFPRYAEMNGLTTIQWDVINLFNWSIAAVLLFTAVLTLLIARARSLTLHHLRIFSALLFGFWACRLVLEFIFPTRIPFVFIPNPSMLLKILMFVALAILIMPELISKVMIIRASRAKGHRRHSDVASLT